ARHSQFQPAGVSWAYLAIPTDGVALGARRSGRFTVCGGFPLFDYACLRVRDALGLIEYGNRQANGFAALPASQHELVSWLKNKIAVATGSGETFVRHGKRFFQALSALASAFSWSSFNCWSGVSFL